MKPTPTPINLQALVEALEVARDQIITMYRTWVVDDATAMPTEISLAGRAIAKIDAALSVPAAAVVGEPVARDIDWGGQAFPSEGGSDSGLHPDPGMSLRDFHASSALKGFCANPAIFAGNDYSGWALVNCTEEQLAVVCHRLADAMIAARKKVASHE